jgi:hypothetical protein
MHMKDLAITHSVVLGMLIKTNADMIGGSVL